MTTTRSPYERALKKVSRPDGDDGCWIWTGSRVNGYGRIAVAVSPGRSVPAQAHRVIYEAAIGPIPEGLHLDHLCCNRSCVNPRHLEPVTHVENMRRARVLRTSCRAGHHDPQRDARGDCLRCKAARESRRSRRTTTNGLKRTS